MKTKKRSSPKLRPVALCRLPPFEAQFSLASARSWSGGKRRNLMVRISVLAHKFRDGDQKKGFRRAFTCVFHFGTKLRSRLGSTGPKMHSSGSGLLLSFVAHFSLGGAHFSLGGHKQWFGGHGPEMPPVAPCLICVWICIFGATCHQAKSWKPVSCDSRYEGCVVQDGTKHSLTDSKKGNAPVTLIQ